MIPGRAVVARTALDRMKTEATKEMPRESGGLLIGHFVDERVLITEAGDPGPRAMRGRSRFRRDGLHAQALLDAAVAASNGAVDYVGEWHSHPLNQPASPVDQTGMAQVSQDPDYKRAHPILLVLRRVSDDWMLDAATMLDGRLISIAVEIEEPQGPA